MNNKNLNSLSATISTEYDLLPNKNNSDSNSLEVNKGYNKALAAYSIISKNCNTSCLSALDIKTGGNDIKHYGSEMFSKLSTCVNRCLIQRMKDHFPDNENINDFVYSTAFAHSHRNQFHLNSYNITRKENIYKKENNSLNDILDVSKSINNYFN